MPVSLQQPVVIRDFHTGVMRSVESPMPETAVSRAINCNFDTLGSVQGRKGITLVGAMVGGSAITTDFSPDGDAESNSVDGYLAYKVPT